MIFGCPISERINLVDGVVFGTEQSDLGEEVACYKLQADSEDTPPAYVHRLHLPVEWPFLLDINDYDAKDEPSVRTINSISMAVDFMRRKSSNLSEGVEITANEIQKVERGHDLDTDNINIGVNKILTGKHWQQYVQDAANEFSILAEQCPSSRVTELEQWCESVASQYEPIRHTVDEAVVYDTYYQSQHDRDRADVQSVVPEQRYVDQLVDSWKEYEAATTDVDLDEIVWDIYDTMDSIEVSL